MTETVIGTLWMLHHHSGNWTEMMVGREGSAGRWIAIERESSAYESAWDFMGLPVKVTVENDKAVSVEGYESAA